MNAGNRAIPGQQEAALLDYIGRLRKNAAGRRAIHLRMSALSARNREPQRLHIASLVLEPLISGFEGTLFRLQNDDFYVFCKDAEQAAIDRTIAHIKNLFIDDPAIKDAGPDVGDFCQQFDLVKAYGSALDLARKAHETAQAPAATSAGGAAVKAPAKAAVSRRALDPKMLGSMQAAIARADLTNVIRRQLVCAVTPGQPPQPVFSEVFTSMSALRQVLSPDVDIHQNRWLFQDLTTHLDRRVISFLGQKDDSTLKRAFGINLNVSCLTSNEFLSFDQHLSTDVRRTVVIELQLIDVLSDVDDFIFARNFLRDRSYRFCLDGLTYQSLPMINCKRLGVDLVKIIWSPELHRQALIEDSPFRQAVAAIDPKRAILIRCDDELALETGKALGVSLYQGFMIDKMLKARRAKPTAG